MPSDSAAKVTLNPDPCASCGAPAEAYGLEEDDDTRFQFRCPRCGVRAPWARTITAAFFGWQDLMQGGAEWTRFRKVRKAYENRRQTR